MKILIFGAEGQLGKSLYHLFKAKADVRAKGRLELDITDKNAVINEIVSFRPNFIFNAAAYTDVEAAERNKNLALKINSDALTYIAKSAKDIGSVLFHFSTDYVFDGTSSFSYREIDKTEPVNFYGKSKLIGEKNVQDNMDDYFIIRTSWIFSEEGNNFPKKILKLAAENESLNIVTDQYSSPTYATDIANAVHAIINHIVNGKKVVFGIYHFSGYPYTNWYSFAKKIIDVAQKRDLISSNVKIKPILSNDLNLLAKRPLNSRLDCSKIKANFGIGQLNWKKALEDIIFDLK